MKISYTNSNQSLNTLNQFDTYKNMDAGKIICSYIWSLRGLRRGWEVFPRGDTWPHTSKRLTNEIESWLRVLAMVPHFNGERGLEQRFNECDRRKGKVHFSSHHSFSLRICSSSSGVKWLLLLKVFMICSGVFPLIMLATVLQVTSSRPSMSK